MSYYCERCRAFLFGEDRDCSCKPFTIIDENNYDCGIYHAVSDTFAAERYAEKSNESGDNYLMDDSVVITVIDSKGNKKKFEISAELDYRAEEVEEGEEGGDDE